MKSSVVFLIVGVLQAVYVVKTQQPLNAVVSLGGQVIFTCTTPIISQITWSLSIDGTTTNQITITFGCPGSGYQPLPSPYYAIDVGSNYCNLIVTNITMQQAGVYLCSQGTTIYNALLTVIDSETSEVTVHNQTDIAELDKLNITCTVACNGSTSPFAEMPPKLSWPILPGQDFTVIATTTTQNEVVSYGQLTVKPPTVPILQCSATFSLIGNLSGYATNIPANAYIWNTTQVYDVLYAPSQIQTISTFVDECIYKAETFTCSALGNPSPSYEWRNISDNTVTVGSALTISKGGQYQCIATNTIRGQNHNISATTVNVTGCVPVTNGSITITGSSCVPYVCICLNGSSEVSLTCQAYSLPKANYFEWKFDMQEVVGTTQTINATNNGIYTCTACNNYTDSSPKFCGSAAVIVFNCFPITTTPNGVKVGMTSNVGLLALFVVMLPTVGKNIFQF